MSIVETKCYFLLITSNHRDKRRHFKAIHFVLRKVNHAVSSTIIKGNMKTGVGVQTDRIARW
jgi:hypothetical protein